MLVFTIAQLQERACLHDARGWCLNFFYGCAFYFIFLRGSLSLYLELSIWLVHLDTEPQKSACLCLTSATASFKKKIKPEFWRLNSGSRELLPQLRHPQFLYSVPLKKCINCYCQQSNVHLCVYVYVSVLDSDINTGCMHCLDQKLIDKTKAMKIFWV